MLQLGLQKACLSQVERKNSFLPGWTWIENTIWLADFLSKEISLADKENQVK